ncbi:hypothetical protein FJTKL_09209 [Diaporthe vaccinii]|uniref:Uncharacterized protein n=1 Tax=Diaporthe vaccinii TaxID=105482 RepID=A0ABR4ENF9_9PEZI
MQPTTVFELLSSGESTSQTTVLYRSVNVTSTLPAYFLHVSSQSLISTYIPPAVFSELAASVASAAWVASVTGDATQSCLCSSRGHVSTAVVLLRYSLDIRGTNECVGGEFKRVEGHALDGERVGSYLNTGNNVYGYVPCLAAFLRPPHKPDSLNLLIFFSF